MSTSLNPQEIEHFSKDSAHWWDENGPFRPLHRLNPVRLRYIRDQLALHYRRDATNLAVLKGLTALDVGCGGGLVCEPLCRMGAVVTGIDADTQAIAVARQHAAQITLKIDYQTTTAERYLSQNGAGKFDVVLALEIVEHVTDRDFFVQTCAALCKPDGMVILSTLNRTPKSFALGIIAAENILRWVPRGTHDWRKFVRPSELAASARKAGLIEKNIEGYGFNVLSGQFELTGRNVAVNYFMTFNKPEACA